MPDPELHKCCIKLKTVCLIIGYLNLVFVLLMSVSFVYVAVENADLFNTGNRALYLLFVIVCLIVLLMSWDGTICLLVGLHQNEPELLKRCGKHASITLFITVRNFFYLDPDMSVEIALNVTIFVLTLFFTCFIVAMYEDMKSQKDQIDASSGSAVTPVTDTHCQNERLQNTELGDIKIVK